MSKRYGRQQKRKAALEIETLNEAVQRAIDKNMVLQMLSARNSQIVKDTARVLGPNFITLDAESVRQSNPLVERWRTSAYEELNVASVEDCAQYCAEAFRVLDLPVMGFKSMRDEMRGQVHYRIKYDRIQVGYAIQMQTLQHMPKDVAVRTIMREMVEQFSKEFH